MGILAWCRKCKDYTYHSLTTKRVNGKDYPNTYCQNCEELDKLVI